MSTASALAIVEQPDELEEQNALSRKVNAEYLLGKWAAERASEAMH